jgi:hypothetical protein
MTQDGVIHRHEPFQNILRISLLLMVLVTACASPPQRQKTITENTATATQTPVAPTVSTTPSPTHTSTPAPTNTPSPSSTPTAVVLIGAGDIGYCGSELPYDGDEKTADLIKSVLSQEPNATVFTAGDSVYGSGTLTEIMKCFEPSWGQFKERIRPSPGNHDYMTDQGAPYYAYFGAAAGEAGKGYYSYDLGDWHIVALNSNCDDIACGPDSQQVKWLQDDLRKSGKLCSLMYWHHPRFSSGLGGGLGSVSTFWKTAVEMGVEVVVNGNDHNYERFSPLDAVGNADPNGTRLFVVGTGGSELRGLGIPQPNSEVRYSGTNGVIMFRLFPGRYEWKFIPVQDISLTDAGTGVCH